MTAADLAEFKLKAFACTDHAVLSRFPFISLIFGCSKRRNIFDVSPGQAMPMSSKVQTQGLSRGCKSYEIDSAACSSFSVATLQEKQTVEEAGLTMQADTW